jgi:hypothetical protein
MPTSIHDNTKTRKPRAPQTGELVGVRLQPDALDRLDAWRRIQDDLPSRPEAMRRLFELGLQAKAKGKARD